MAKRIIFTPQIIQQMGKMPDKIIAEQLGCSEMSICLHRKKLGIPAYQPRKFLWSDLAKMDQSEFIKLMLSKSNLKRVELSKRGCFSFSRLEKWAAPGGGREPLPIYIRKLIFLICVYDAKKQPT
jgi:hypothetical protein